MARKEWIRNNPEKYRIMRRAQEARRQAKVREWMDAFKASHPCACGESDVACLEFHHADDETKRFSMAKHKDYTLTAIMRELAKCEPMCANCHRKGHAGRPSCERHVPLFKDCSNHWQRKPARQSQDSTA